MHMQIVKKVRGNAWLFLRRAIKELISHDDSNDDGLNEERAIMATTLIQMSFELSLVAYFLKVDGIRGVITAQDASLSEAELITKFENNDLQTKPFNLLKKEALARNILLCEDDEYFITEFQKIRNKLIHLNYKFCEGDLYDLKYDLTYFIIKVVIPTLADEENRFSEVISINIDPDDFKRLIKFPPYAHQMHNVAKDNSENVYRCIHCGNNSLATDFGEEYCHSCGMDLSHAGFIDCPYCKAKRSMIYDAMNIECQVDKTINGLCLNCHDKDVIYVCEKCESEVALEANIGNNRCHPGFCEYDE